MNHKRFSAHAGAFFSAFALGVSALTVATICASPRSAAAQTIRFKENDGTPYSVEPVGDFKPKKNNDGTVTVRVKLTLHYSRIPDCYEMSREIPVFPDYPSGIPGPQMGRTDLTKKPVTDSTTGKIAVPEKNKNEERFNTLRDLVSRAEQNAVRDTALPKNWKTKVNDKLIFGYGDWLYNTRLARDLAYYGLDMISGAAYREALDKLKGTLKLVKDPTNPMSVGTNENLEDAAWQDHSLWHFKAYLVSPKNSSGAAAEMGGKVMVEVKIVWILEATFKADNPPAFPLVGSIPPNEGQASGENIAANAPGAGEVQSPAPATSAPSFIGQFLFGNALGLEGDLKDSRGFEAMLGWSVQNNGRPTFIGVNVSRPVEVSTLDESFKQKLVDFDLRRPFRFFSSPRTGLMIGVSNSGSDTPRNAVLFTLSHKIHPLVNVFAGTAVGEVQNNPRFGPVFGVGFNLSEAFNPTKRTPPAELKLEIAKSDKPRTTPCLITANTALLWGTYLQRGEKLEVTFDQNGTSHTATIAPVTNEAKTTVIDDRPWVTWERPGTIKEIKFGNTSIATVTVYTWNGFQWNAGTTIDLTTGQTFLFEKGKVYRLELKKPTP